MYSQQSRTSPIPKNYSGNAFRYPPIGSLNAQDDLPPCPEAERMPPTQSYVAQEEDPKASSPVGLPVPALHESGGMSSGTTSVLDFLSGIGSEELLLLGLCLLLMGQNEGNGDNKDLLLCLLLLFFFH